MERALKIVLAVFLVLLTAIAAGQGPAPKDSKSSPGPRTWTDSTGKYKVTATLIDLRDEKVRLKREDGTILEVPLSRFSAEDQQAAKAIFEQMRLRTRPAGGDDAANPFDAPAKAESLSVQEVSRRVERGIVCITTRDHLGDDVALGTGFVIDASGLVVTNYHVIKEAASASAKFRDGTEVQVAGYRSLDKQRDLAILQLKAPPRNLAVLKVGPFEGLKQGDPIIAIGHPRGFTFTVSNGIISAIRKTSEMPEQVQELLKSHPECQWLQISAPSAAGSSGGPLLNARGDVVGVVTWMVPGQGLGFAVHAQHMAELRRRLGEKEYPLPVPGSFQGPAVSVPEVLDQLRKLRQDMAEMYVKLNSVTSPEKQIEIFRSENPVPAHVAKFRKLAEMKPGTPQEFESLVTIARIAGDEHEPAETKQSLRWAFGRLVQAYGGDERLGGLMLELGRAPNLEVQAFMREMTAKSPHKQVKGLACLALGAALRDNPKTNGRCEEESVTILERAVSEFGSIAMGDTTLAELVRPYLREAKWLSVGRLAQEIEGKDSKGRTFRLSDSRGKVVLLDFWVDWCPYCREMYPHERMLLKKHSDKPFTILGVNCEGLDRMQQVEASGNVTWRSWANGKDGPIAQQWNIAGFPTIYLLDAGGRIRRKGNLRGEILDRAVESVLKEMELGLANDLVEPCAVWNYWDDPEPLKPDWPKPGFDDSEWKTGRAVLGYGTGDEATTLGPGPNEPAKTPSAYFRRKFKVNDPTKVPAMVLGMACADGAAVFLNGHEVVRENLDPGAQHFAPKRSPNDGLVRLYYDVDAKLLQPGENVVAVEVHRRHLREGVMRFELTLSSTPKPTGGKELTVKRKPGPAVALKVDTNSIGMKLLLIPAGEFLMGSPDSDSEATADEKPQHRVRVTKPFWLGTHEVTVGQFRQFAESGEYKGSDSWKTASQTDQQPVVNVSWEEADAFCKWLSQKESHTYRLPTEAQWEYACRAGSTTKYYCGDGEGTLDDYAWYSSNSSGQTHPVGQKKPNAWGLYDMHGNAWEWCNDWWYEDYANSAAVDPMGPSAGSERVNRGGGWNGPAGFCRSADRFSVFPGYRDPNLGFRVSRVVE